MRRGEGFTLIELMIGILIGLIVTLAAMTILADSEGRRRTQSSVNTIDQSGDFTAYILDDQIRNAGSGFGQSWNYTFGCLLNGAVSGSTLFPLPNTMPAPFAGVAAAMGAFRLAPIIILKGASQAGSDVLVIAAGTSGFGEIAIPFGSVPGSAALNLTGTTTLIPNDLMLVADQNAAGGNVAACMLEQASSSFSASSTTTQVPLAGAYYQASGSNTSLTSYSASGMAMPLGNAVNGNPPTIALYGVGANNLTATSPTGYALYTLNLLTSGAAPVAISDGVLQMRALYGIDTTGNGLVDTWQDPATGNYAPSTLLNGSVASAQLLQRIKAIRLGLVIQSSLQEKPDPTTNLPVSPATITMFSDLGLTQTVTLTAAQQNYRYRVIETTIPLRNTLLLTN